MEIAICDGRATKFVEIVEMTYTNHKKDDDGQYAQSVRQSTGVMRYLFQAPRRTDTRANTTLEPRGVLQGIQVNTCANMPLVDVDSEMLGITRRSDFASQFDIRNGFSRCVMREPTTSEHFESQHGGGVAVGTTSLLDGEDCRFSNPPSTLRGTGINRFEWLCRDPQDKAISPQRMPINYRMVAKDNHRPLVERPMRDRVSPVDRDEPGVHIEAFTDASDVGRDIDRAVASYPAPVANQHWRDVGEIQRIMGRRPPGPPPAAAEEDTAHMAVCRVRGA